MCVNHTSHLPTTFLSFFKNCPREKCSHNVTVHGLIESSATLPAGRLTEDIQHLSDSILSLSNFYVLPPDVIIFTSGEPITNILTYIAT
ncbi:unnamed protein product [Macrosiphum euphorbiae]|uniref:Uncharacterized protein n=1 Tax=Macrosiphum euphorbiae TaxID=13131 RepID=A0AAV0W715_9HEMI|nr:unnamed protein product [Macrosiphum euphorbiae]